MQCDMVHYAIMEMKHVTCREDIEMQAWHAKAEESPKWLSRSKTASALLTPTALPYLTLPYLTCRHGMAKMASYLATLGMITCYGSILYYHFDSI